MSIMEIVNDICIKISEEYKLPNGTLCIESNLDKSNSIWLKNPTTMKKTSLALKLFEIPEIKLVLNDKMKIIDNVTPPIQAELSKVKSDTFHTYAKFEAPTESLYTFIRDIVIYCVLNFEPDDKFGCCGKYIECSDAGECLHENKFYARACWYRKNLEQGKVFYGMNKNM